MGGNLICELWAFNLVIIKIWDESEDIKVYVNLNLHKRKRYGYVY